MANISTGAQQDGMMAAAKMVDFHLQQDSSYPALVDLLKVGGVISDVSGLDDNDYPGLTKLASSLLSLAQLHLTHKMPLPAELLEQLSHMQSSCLMGIFPEINRAWVTVDSVIYWWRFEDGGDMLYFDGVNELILGVGLIKPKEGVFKSHVNYLMCFTTPVEITILGITMVERNSGSSVQDEMYILPEALFTLSTDSTFLVTIKGTAEGRIFLGGKNGCLYEVTYQARDGWFSPRCKKINHSSSYLSLFVPSVFNFAFPEDDGISQIEVDNSRHILYTRSSRGNIQVFDLGPSGTQTSCVAGLTQATIQRQAQRLAKTIDAYHFQLVITISVVEVSESLHINLVGVTTSGIRLYFTCTSLTTPALRPHTLKLVHIRLPPGFSPNSAPQNPHQVQLARYSKGTLLLASSQGEDNELLWAMDNDAFPFWPHLMELHTTMLIDGQSQAVAELPNPAPHSTCHMMIGKIVVPSTPPLVVTQHLDPPRRFVFLSTQGVHIVSKLRPVDQLRQLLVDNQGPDCEAVKVFFGLHQEVQACATCLVLACSLSPQDRMVAEWATQAFLRYGGEARPSYFSATPGPTPYSPTPAAGNTMVHTQSPEGLLTSPGPGPYSPYQGGPIISTPVASHYAGMQTLPVSPVTASQVSPPPSFFPAQGFRSDITHSNRHNALYLYLSRILRPLWNVKMVAPYSCSGSQGNIELLGSNIPVADLDLYITQLRALLAFVEANSRLPHSSAVSSRPWLHSPSATLAESYFTGEADSRGHFQAEAEAQDRASIFHLCELVRHVCEVLGLWKVLCEHQLHQVTMLLTNDIIAQLRNMLAKDFILSSRGIAGALASALINFYFDNQANTESIISRLREVCPSIYRSEDALFSKANEKLLKAKDTTNQAEKQILLRDALQLCKQIGGQLELGAVCGALQEARHYTGIVELCEATAGRRDPEGNGLFYYRNNEPPEDARGLQAFLARTACYKCVTSTLAQLLAQASAHPQSPRLPLAQPPQSQESSSQLTREEAKLYADQMLDLAFMSKDELFHVIIFSWMADSQLTDRLLSVKSPFLQSYLQRCANLQPDNIAALNLLEQYYERNQKYASAARILAKLAQRPGADINLEQRVNHLAHAIVCLKSSTPSLTASNDGEFLHDLEEKLEVARIQEKIFKALQHVPSTLDHLAELNSRLLDITTLYERYAEPHGLPECKLAIICCADHYDPTLVEKLWQEIIDKELSSNPSPELMASKITTLAKIYSTSRKFFPLAYIVRTLELKTCSLPGFDPGWVSKALSRNVTVGQLVEVYHRLYQARDPAWLSCPQHHLLACLARLVDQFLAESGTASQDRLRLGTKLQDQISIYLVDLQASCDTSHPLVQQFRLLQAKLERFL